MKHKGPKGNNHLFVHFYTRAGFLYKLTLILICTVEYLCSCYLLIYLHCIKYSEIVNLLNFFESKSNIDPRNLGLRIKSELFNLVLIVQNVFTCTLHMFPIIIHVIISLYTYSWSISCLYGHSLFSFLAIIYSTRHVNVSPEYIVCASVAN